jgi:hypothetical protein
MQPLPIVLTLVLSVGPLAASTVQSPASAAAAKQLTELMTAKSLDTIAAIHPEESDRFVAAMHIKGVQLLVITSKYAAPSLLKEKLLKGDHRGVYLDLNAAGTREGRFFVEDMQANGLLADRAPNAPFDIVTRDMTSRMLYDAGWKARRQTETAYRDQFSRDDAEYAKLLGVLIAALQPTTSH